MSYVYFIHCVGTNYVKIGIATDVNKRLANLQTANPHQLKLLGFKEGGRDEEMWFHMFFKNRHVRGEWLEFRNVERALYIFEHYSIQDMIEEMNAKSAVHRAREDERFWKKMPPELHDRVRSIVSSVKMSYGNARA